MNAPPDMQSSLYDIFLSPFADFEFMRRALVGALALALAGAPLGVFLILLLPLPVLYEVVADQFDQPPVWVFETTGYLIIMIAFAVPYLCLSTRDWRSMGVFLTTIACGANGDVVA